MLTCLLLACNSPSSDGSEPPKDEKIDPGVEEGRPDPNAGPPGEVDENCEFMVKEKCYTDQKAACEAAGCPDTCVVMETFPGTIQCS